MLFSKYYVMADVIAIVADVSTTMFVCMEWLMLLPKWQMELPHMNGLMLLPNVADGTATFVTAYSLFIVADGIATL